MDHPKPQCHVCTDCGRTYRAVETLNRHRKNHSDTVSYACSSCNSSFKRKDLLDRHLQVHLHAPRGKSRQRNQRACLRCSRLKTRCDNQTPCSRCVKADHQCIYRDNPARSNSLRSIDAASDRSRASSTVSSDASPDTTIELYSTSLPTISARTEEWHGSFGIDTTWMTTGSLSEPLPTFQEPGSAPYTDHSYRLEQGHAPESMAYTLPDLASTSWEPPSMIDIVAHSYDTQWPPHMLNRDSVSLAPVSTAITYQESDRQLTLL